MVDNRLGPMHIGDVKIDLIQFYELLLRHRAAPIDSNESMVDQKDVADAPFFDMRGP